jgi:hypothetical protein
MERGGQELASRWSRRSRLGTWDDKWVYGSLSIRYW